MTDLKELNVVNNVSLIKWSNHVVKFQSDEKPLQKLTPIAGVLNKTVYAKKNRPGNESYCQCNCEFEYSTLDGSIVYQSS